MARMDFSRVRLAVWVFIGLLILSGCASQVAQKKASDRQKPAKQNTEAIQPETASSSNAVNEPPLEDVTEAPEEVPLLRLVIVSDMNGRYGSAEYDSEVVQGIDMILADRPDIVINAGDMVAGQRAKLNYRKMWQGFHAVVTDRLKEAGIPMAQVVGNHDGSAYSQYEKEREIYIDEWTQRKPALDYVDDAHYPLYYSFRFRDVLFVGLDWTRLEKLDEEQYQWLDQQLASNPTGHRPVVFGHIPLFPITTIKPTEILRDERLPGLFSKYRVQLVITGHQQAYFPAMLGGVVYVHSGALGGGPRPVRQNDGIAPKTLTFVNLYDKHEPYIDTRVINGSVGERFNHNLLPTYIMFGNKLLPRVDISMEDAEFARDYMISPHMPKNQMLTLIRALRESGGDWGKVPDWK